MAQQGPEPGMGPAASTPTGVGGGCLSRDPLLPSKGAGRVCGPTSSEPVLITGEAAGAPPGWQGRAPGPSLAGSAGLSLQDGSCLCTALNNTRLLHARVGF